MKKFKKIVSVLFFMFVVTLVLPNSVSAAEMSEEFKTWLNEDGEFVVNASKGTTDEDLYLYLDFKYSLEEPPYRIRWGNQSEDFNTFDFTIYADDEEKEETHTVKIKYNYDEKVNEMINNYLNTTLKGKEEFEVKDMELVSYWINNTQDNNNSLALFSGELKELLDYKNIQLFTDSRAGGYDRFITSNLGFASFQSDGISYKMSPKLGAYAEHVIYIDESVGNTEEEIVAAVQKRIDEQFGKDKVLISFGGEGLYNLYVSEYDTMISFYKTQIETYERYETDYAAHCENNPNADVTMCDQLKTFRDNLYKEITENGYESEIEYLEYYKSSFIDQWNDPNGSYSFLKKAVNDWFFLAEIDFGDMFFLAEFIVVRDSSKMVKPIVKTADAQTDIEISTSENLPLDTAIQAKQLTDGEEYERVVELLDLTDNVTYDLKLYSSTADEYITQLENGEFEVKIPIPEDFKGKDLYVYYVGASDEPETFDVEIQGSYAVFKTNHFSVYTLGYKGDELSNPQTLDNITNSVVLGFVSIIGLFGTSIYFISKRKNN